MGYSVVVDSVLKSRASGKKLLYKYLGNFHEDGQVVNCQVLVLEN